MIMSMKHPTALRMMMQLLFFVTAASAFVHHDVTGTGFSTTTPSSNSNSNKKILQHGTNYHRAFIINSPTTVGAPRVRTNDVSMNGIFEAGVDPAIATMVLITAAISSVVVQDSIVYEEEIVTETDTTPEVKPETKPEVKEEEEKEEEVAAEATPAPAEATSSAPAAAKVETDEDIWAALEGPEYTPSSSSSTSDPAASTAETDEEMWAALEGGDYTPTPSSSSTSKQMKTPSPEVQEAFSQEFMDYMDEVSNYGQKTVNAASVRAPGDANVDADGEVDVEKVAVASTLAIGLERLKALEENQIANESSQGGEEVLGAVEGGDVDENKSSLVGKVVKKTIMPWKSIRDM